MWRRYPRVIGFVRGGIGLISTLAGAVYRRVAAIVVSLDESVREFQRAIEGDGPPGPGPGGPGIA